MTSRLKYLLTIVFIFVTNIAVQAQAEFTINKADCKVPIARQMFHDQVDKIQKKISMLDGKADNRFTPSANDEVNFFLTQTLTTNIDELQCRIEADSTIGTMDKIRYLRGIEETLNLYLTDVLQKKYKPTLLPETVNAFQQCLNSSLLGQNISGIIEAFPYEVGNAIINCRFSAFELNAGYKVSKGILIRKYCLLRPQRCFSVLQSNPELPFTDSLIKVVGRKYPGQLYDYAQSATWLGNHIRSITDDSFVKTIVQMAGSKSGQQYYPFLDNIVNGKLSFEEVDKVKDDEALYFRLLVNTRIDYVARALRKDTAFEFQGLAKKLTKKAVEIFVNTINSLHFENDNIRYKIIQPLTAQELYYIAVEGDGVIYTSSFVNGVYPLMMKKIDNRGDSLLNLVSHDRYRRFIKMGAGYNTLDNFLTTYPDKERTDSLMKAFVSNLERIEGLEDGVNVADSYGSIVESLRPVAKEMLKNIEANYARNQRTKNSRGIAIYNILKTLFYSADSTIDLTQELGIPPVYQMPFSSLVNDSGRAIMQVFFFGDKDGQSIFNGFQNMFANANWRIDKSNPQWIVINSAKGKPISIYANRALPEETGEDEDAQVALCEYLQEHNLNPTITIHRGHSYFAPSTIAKMASSSKIVFLGSCGGYHLNFDVLDKSPDAHIISSKQIGKTAVNKPFFSLLTDKIRTGKNIEWIPFWKEFAKMAKVEGFEDYIPPYKNLGAIYIKAYKIATEKSEAEQEGLTL